ncbi:G-protein coupled receptor kinase [Aureococcus anophagefferens]|uniref:G-protein coupled receptor kinase n=2 Tax=Aureococcus anophagefferens TaxID=44056 RepID=A0ABR1G3I2_AURAN
MQSSDNPDPREEYATFPEDELMAFFGRAEDSGFLTMENILKGPLGFWMFTLWMSRHAEKTFHNVGQFIVEVATLKLARGKHIQEQKDKIMSSFLPEMNSAVNEMKPEYVDSDMCRKVRPPVGDKTLYQKHIKEGNVGNMQRESASKMSRRASVASTSKSFWPVLMGGSLVDSSAPPQSQFDVIEALLVDYCEKVALPLWLNKDTNPKLLEYLRYLKIQHEVPPTEKTFNVFRTMGKGGFGLVKGCRTFTTGRMYAMKEMDMKHVKQKKCKTLCDQEHWALSDPLVCDSPFCVNMKYAFKTEAALCLVIDLMMGGDLSFHLDKAEGRKMPENFVRYYSARVILGLEVMHEAKIVYRDLKPENVLVDGDGRTRLSDLGLAVPLAPGLKGTAGTPGYLAPEMLQHKPYDQSVDWWSFGCMIYEMVNGVGPFRTEEANKFGGETNLQKAVNKATCEMEIEWPSHFSPEFTDLCKKILCRDPEKRFKIKDIMNHEWYKPLDWELMRADPDPEEIGEGKPEYPPIVPGKKLNIEDAGDIGEFEDLGDAVTLVPEDFPEKEWLYVSEKYFQSEVVWLLQFREKDGGAPPPAAASSGACQIL